MHALAVHETIGQAAVRALRSELTGLQMTDSAFAVERGAVGIVLATQ